jgi:hypothetical protein
VAAGWGGRPIWKRVWDWWAHMEDGVRWWAHMVVGTMRKI